MVLPRRAILTLSLCSKFRLRRGGTGLASPGSQSEPVEVSTFAHAVEFSKTAPLAPLRKKASGSHQRPSWTTDVLRIGWPGRAPSRICRDFLTPPLGRLEHDSTAQAGVKRT